MAIHRRLMLARLLAGASAIALKGVAHAQNVTYTYDALGRISTAAFPNGTTITYTYDPAGNRTQVVQAVGAGAPMGTFAASPTTVAPGGSSILTWTSSGAASASISNSVGTVTPVTGGSVQVSPATTTTYTLTLTGAGGQATLQAIVTIA
ncbi:MAG: RHS repeat protein [Hyphomonadaceae bacterium]|nr:RHS repeat protein [Hyphomonadaceae bacterium]